ncbi:MAG: fatty acid desaturase, partial [Geitlerinemataceae cyanobacterium]
HPMRNSSIRIESFFQRHRDSIIGISSAAIVFGVWGSSLIWLFRVDFSTVPLWLVAVIFFVRMFMHTGLFITAHDAMHGSACPSNPKLNHAIGAIVSMAYALLPYNILRENHMMHHRHPGREGDPDYSQKHQNNPVLWYINFMIEYMKFKHSWVQMVAMTALFHSLHLFLHINIWNVLFFWALPMIFSSAQMFYFGVFLPHREPEGGYTNRHHAQSSYFSVFWSFVTCYHFGYHWEHHEFPHLPWYKLPSAVQSH